MPTRSAATRLTPALKSLSRPRMLVGAARKGLAFYRRDRDLPVILRGLSEGQRKDTGRALLACEQALEDTRTARDLRYSLSDHIAVLTALMAEAATETRLRAASSTTALEHKAAA